MSAYLPLSARLIGPHPAGSDECAAMAVAIHEAGHLLAARLVGVEPSRVLLRADGGGSMWHSQATDAQDLVLTVAGGAAERELGARDAEAIAECGRTDRLHAVGVARRILPRNPDGAIVRANGQAAELLRAHWPAVEWFSRYLLAEREVSGPVLLAAVDAALAGAFDVRAAAGRRIERERATAQADRFIGDRRRIFERLVSEGQLGAADFPGAWQQAAALAGGLQLEAASGQKG